MKNPKKMILFAGALAVIVCGYPMNKGVISVSVPAHKSDGTYKVVIDAGHGGSDPGKVGVNQTEEKEINLQIAIQLKELLEQEDIEVVMTREEDGGLYLEKAANKKLEDMRARCKLMEEEDPDLVVSIHQNSYTDSSVRGAQVFYYGQSAEGKKAAECIQNALSERLDKAYSRECKANESYYILKKTVKPAVIVECGFLSNPEEEALLNTPEYQKKIVWAIHFGVLQYLKGLSL